MQPYIHPCIEAYFLNFIIVYWQTCILPYLHCCTCIFAYLHSRLLPDTCQSTSTHPRTHLPDTFRKSSKHLPSLWRVNLGKWNYFLYQKLIISRLFLQLVLINLEKYDQNQRMVTSRGYLLKYWEWEWQKGIWQTSLHHKELRQFSQSPFSTQGCPLCCAPSPRWTSWPSM